MRALTWSIGLAGWLAGSTLSHAQADCPAIIAAAQEAARDIVIAVGPEQRVPAGEPLRISWTNGQPKPEQFRAPTYLTLSAPAEVRFGGSGFLALTAPAKAPFGLKAGKDRARAVVALHRSPNNGFTDVKFYRAGPTTIDWAVTLAGACGEHELARGSAAVQVVPGGAELVLQDRFSTEKPLKRLRSRSGVYELLVFDRRYTVEDVASGARLVDRAGTEPNFSPTGRFVAARQLNDGALEVVDLVSAKPVMEFSTGFLAWAGADSFAIYGGDTEGRVAVVNTLTDGGSSGSAVIALDASCKACGAWRDTRVALDLEHGFAAVFGSGDSAAADLYTREVLTAGGDIEDGDTRRRALEALIRRRFDGSYSAPSNSWAIGEPVALSHASALRAEDRKQHAKLVVAHVGDERRPAQRSGSQPDQAPVLRSLTMSARGLAREPSTANTNPGELFARLADAGIETLLPKPAVRIGAGMPPEWDDDPKYKAVIAAALDEIVRRIPEAKAVFKSDDGCVLGQPPGPNEVRRQEISQIYRWNGALGLFWIIQTVCHIGSAGQVNHADVFLFSEKDLSKRAQSINDALGSAAKPGTMLDHEAGKFLLFPGDDNTIIVASRLGESAAVLGPSASREGAVIPLADAALLKEVRRTPDGRHLVQLNSEGRFHVYRIADGHRVFGGAIVDDEVITVTGEGLYDTTFEGAHAVQVRFGGLPGQFSFHQFESMLRRQALARSLLGGTPLQPPGSIPRPPQVTLTMAGLPKNDRRAATVTATSERALKEVRLYVDGRLVQAIPMEGVRAESTVDLSDPGGARWVTAVAVDVDGLVSLPSALQLPGRPRPRGVLRAVVAGIDTYDDSQIPPLGSARRDARNMAGVLATAGRQAFASVETPQLFLDHEAAPGRLLAAVSAAAKLTAPDDTLLFFFAGHGFDAGPQERSGGLRLITSGTRLDDLTSTVSWDALVEAVAAARGRVLIVIDACHAGLAGGRPLATNEALVNTLFTRAGAAVVVLAASKGRQLSQERKGGEFTNALVAALTGKREAIDRDRSGLIDLGELYAAVKTGVVRKTNGAQTPWLARNGLVGEMSLF